MQLTVSDSSTSRQHAGRFQWSRLPLRAMLVTVAGALLCLTVLCPSPAVAQSGIPFRATLREQVVAHLCPFPVLCFSISGDGQATQLGNTSEASSASINLLTIMATGCAPESRTATLTAANGDELYASFAGTTCGNAQSGSSTYAFVVTGGTGRFTAAGGGGTSTATYSSAGSTTILNGTLTLPHPSGD